ncbi:MAG: molybdopterin-dependent oxidoreductase, partial [Candidatus Puniceispirillales bacterium]
ITAPMVRKSWLDAKSGMAGSDDYKPENRGRDPFVAVSWQKAEELVADELKRVISDHGNESIFAGSYGWASAGRFHHAQSQIHRFLNCVGGYTKSVNTYSFAAAEVIVPHVIGDFRHYIYHQTSWRSVIEHTELLVAFGGLPVKNGQIGQGGLGNHIQAPAMQAAADNGVSFVNISPLRHDISDHLDAEWVPIRPNTDTALILALCHTLITEDLYDKAFVDRYTTGFAPFADYVLGRTDDIEKTAHWASAIPAVPADRIITLARQMVEKRSMISLSWSLTRQQYGEEPYWAGIVLAALIGQIGLPGGGFGMGYSALNTIGHNINNLEFTALPQGQNAVDRFIPVARISDMLLHPGQNFRYNGGEYTYPDIKLMYWAGGNPFHHHQDLQRMVKAWQKPDTIIVHEWCWNANAKFADIVLPCTTTLERQDIAMSPRDNHVVSMDQAIPPVGQARDDYQILSGIAKHMGCAEAFTEGRSAEEWQRWLYDMSRQSLSRYGKTMPDYDDFRKQGWFVLPEEKEPMILLKDFRDDPDKHPLKTPSGRIEISSERIKGFDLDDFPGFPYWQEPSEWLGVDDLGMRLHMINNQPHNKLHSQLDHGKVSAAVRINGHEPVVINPSDAAIRGINDGDLVHISNDRGSMICGAVHDANIMAGVILVRTGAWYDPDLEGELSCKHGNPNVLTPDIGTSSMAQGPAAHTCLVSITPWTGGSINVTAHQPPEMADETKNSN